MRLGPGAASALAPVTALVALAACGGAKAAPPPATDAATPTVAVTLTATGCSPTDFSLPPGPVIFRVTNPGVRVTEMEVQSSDHHVVSDVEGVTVGHTRSFVVNLVAGATYLVRCPESAPGGGVITVR